MTEPHMSFEDFLVQLRDEARSTTDQGTKFELAMAALLPHLPEYQFDAAWLWKDWPQRREVTDRNAQDVGVDIVARLRDTGEYWAIQCKFYDPSSSINLKELGTFFTASGIEGFSGRLIITTTDKWTGHAESMLKNQQIETKRLRLQDLQHLNIAWNWLRPDKTKIIPAKLKKLYPLQKDAFDAATAHFVEHDRGRMIMACGTGKTFTSLKIAENITRPDGYVLFIVPSLSLMKQTITEWAWERTRDHRYLAICSDSTVGNDEDATSSADLTVPVSTNPSRIVSTLTLPDDGKDKSHRLNVVFCTYQSLDKLSAAQSAGAPDFDLIICDEAHRTTGVDREGKTGGQESNSNFVKIHNQDFIKGKKRLYMTATPRIYTEAAQQKAEEHNFGVFSMDNEDNYGEEFYRLGFSKAVSADMLSEYKVIVLTIAQDYVANQLSRLSKDVIASLDPATDDAAKIIGCYKALRDQGKEDGTGKMLKRAVSFSNTIKNSKMVVEKFSKVVAELNALEEDGFTCDLEHVDGKQSTLDRAKHLDWLKDDVPSTDDGEVCRILSNARCLTEGVDVPSLDAVLFMNPRRSQVDVIQAVGRVMRKAEGKDYGYVILPIVVPTDMSVEDALDKNEVFGVVWEVLRALRAHDDSLTNSISKLELNTEKPDNISIIGLGFSRGDGEGESNGTKTDIQDQLNLVLSEELTNLIHAKIVDKVGDRTYLEQWAKDTANLHDLLVRRIDELRNNHSDISTVYDDFLAGLKASINDGLTEDDATSMLAQQLITRPIFDALFDGNQFSQNNVVSLGLNGVLEQLNEYGLDKDLKNLEEFYDSVKSRVSGLDNDEARQKVITELYEKFFATAFPKTSESLGIAYTPIELVDFTLKSADDVMQAEFGRSLSDEGVHIIDPFTGTGSFIVRLLNNPDLINDSDLQRKFTSELWANELLLLAYYIASVNIEMAYRGRGGQEYQSFTGISLTDTFELFEKDDVYFPAMLKDNSKRIKAQRAAPIRVVVGNPPWSGGQKSQNDSNANRIYPALDKSIRDSYAERSSASNLNSLYDSYIRAIRWASGRIGDEGIVAFVTNAGWMEGASTDGMRLCLEEEFDAIYLFNLRGNARLSGEAWKKEGDKIFGQFSRAPVVISLFVKNSQKPRDKAKIHYRDIGDYLTIKEKLSIVRDAKSISGFDFKTITPNPEGDWLNLRDPLFQNFVELSNKAVKRGKNSIPETIFRSYSNGASTNRDAWAYNFSHDNVANNMEQMISNYNKQCVYLAAAKQNNPNISPEEILDNNSTKIKWSSSLISYAERGREGKFNPKNIRSSLYRPFNMENLYLDPIFTHRPAKMFDYFPTPDAENRLICVTGTGAQTDFSCLMTDTIPNLHTLDTGQTFPRWTYQKDGTREDNITNHALDRFQTFYKDKSITKDNIFNYVYGILHAPDYCARFSADLRLDLPRIPMAKDFWAFAEAGEFLAEYHLNWPLDNPNGYKQELGVLLDNTAVFTGMIPKLAYTVKKMSWLKRSEGTFIKYSNSLSIGPIPENALKYTISGRTPLQWIIDRYQVKTNKESGIINDPNDWIAEQHDENGNPCHDALIELIKRVTYLSIQTTRIVEGLPKALEEDGNSGTEAPFSKNDDADNSKGSQVKEHQIKLYPIEHETKHGILDISYFEEKFGKPDPYLRAQEREDCSFLISIDFILPRLNAGIISVEDFTQKISKATLEQLADFIFEDKESGQQFAISDIVIFCQEGSLGGIIKIAFFTAAHVALLVVRIHSFDLDSPNSQASTKIMINEINNCLNCLTINNYNQAETTQEDTAGYSLPEAKISEPTSVECANAMLDKDEKGKPLTDGKDAGKTIQHFTRLNANSEFTLVETTKEKMANNKD